MARTTGLTLEQAKAERKRRIDNGETLSTSKDLGKLENYIKTLQPHNYSDEQVASAQKALRSSTQRSPMDAAIGMSGASGAPGVPDLNSIYDNLFNTQEIRDKKAEISNVEQARDTAITGVQDNPWFSQATRGGKIAGIKSDSERNLTRIGNDLSRLQSDAQIQYNIKLQQYDLNSKAYKDSLTMFSNLLNGGALANASGEDIANLSVQTGIPSSMITSMIDSVKMGNLTLQTVDDGNSQYVVALDKSGNVVNQTYLGSSKGSGGFDTNSFMSNVANILGMQDTSLNIKNETLTPPDMTARPGSTVEYPVGSGIYWTAKADGGWE